MRLKTRLKDECIRKCVCVSPCPSFPPYQSSFSLSPLPLLPHSWLPGLSGCPSPCWSATILDRDLHSRSRSRRSIIHADLAAVVPQPGSAVLRPAKLSILSYCGNASGCECWNILVERKDGGDDTTRHLFCDEMGIAAAFAMRERSVSGSEPRCLASLMSNAKYALLTEPVTFCARTPWMWKMFP